MSDDILKKIDDNIEDIRNYQSGDSNYLSYEALIKSQRAFREAVITLCSIKKDKIIPPNHPGHAEETLDEIATILGVEND